MKKLFLALLAMIAFHNASAKKIKFGVDMAGQIINATGIHVSGDFQTLAGFAGGDWASNTTLLTNEAGTTIYSIVVDIPAFRKYEYKYVNGDMFYEVEFVPLESRVDVFNDNRWIYLDSLSDDTTYIGALLFGGNAPVGLNLMRFVVDMSAVPAIDQAGVHVAGAHQGWDPAKTILYSFGNNIYEVINYAVVGTYEYKYFNGNVTGTQEVVPATCATNGNRIVPVSKDTVIETVCFSSCNSCQTAGISSLSKATFSVFPNPASSLVSLKFENESQRSITLSDFTGRIVHTSFSTGSSTTIERGNLSSGMYHLSVREANGSTSMAKLILE